MMMDGKTARATSCAIFLLMGAPLPASVKRAISRDEERMLGECHTRLNEAMRRSYARMSLDPGDRSDTSEDARAAMMSDFEFTSAELGLVIEALETAARALQQDKRALVYCGGNRFGLTADDYRAMARTLLARGYA